MHFGHAGEPMIRRRYPINLFPAVGVVWLSVAGCGEAPTPAAKPARTDGSAALVDEPHAEVTVKFNGLSTGYEGERRQYGDGRIEDVSK